MRIGIGQPPPRFDASDYVLGRFTQEEQVSIETAVAEAVDGVLLWAQQGPAAAMNRLNPSTLSDEDADTDDQ